jgi:hypothetical protein
MVLQLTWKYVFFSAPSLEILGHAISATGAAPMVDHAAEIENCPPPQDIKQLQRFLSMVNFYCRFFPNCAQILKPLTYLLRGGDVTQEAFQLAKRLLAAAIPLQHPAPNAELSLATDASDTHIGGVMQQKSKDHWQPLGFFSRKLTDTESRYSTFDRELLAAQAAIKHFRHFCEGSLFQLWTDHKPLVTALSRVSTPISPRQQCHLAFISEFNVQLLYLPGLKNVADFFSRPPPPPLEQSPPRWRQIQWILKRWPPSKTVAQKCSVCWAAHLLNWLSARQALNAWLATFLLALFAQLFPSSSEKNFSPIFLTLLTPGGLPPVVLFHPGLYGADFPATSPPGPAGVWPTSRARSTATQAWAPQPIPIPQRRFSHLQVDLVGLLQYSNNFNYIFTIIDRTSKWMEAIPLPDTSPAACAKALPFTWISCFGDPETITSDRGPQFTSNLWFKLCEMLHISHKLTTAYHPESNAAVERLHRSLKDALRARAATATWSEESPFVLFGL